MGNSEDYVLESVLTAQKMIRLGKSKQDVLEYLYTRNNTEEIANNIANLALELTVKSELKEERKTLLGGIGMIIVGVLITAISYIYAESDGGTYVITYGIIIYGIFTSTKSLISAESIKANGRKWKNRIKPYRE